MPTENLITSTKNFQFRCLKFLPYFLVIILTPMFFACSHQALTLPKDPAHYVDNDVPFEPLRLWRLIISFEPDLSDSSKFYVYKDFQLNIRDQQERKLFREKVSESSEESYLRWLSAEFFPLGNSDDKVSQHLTEYKDLTQMTISFKSRRSVSAANPNQPWVSASPIFFPDPLWKAFHEGCAGLNWDTLDLGQSLGFEITYKTRNLDPKALKWTKKQFENDQIFWKVWSVGQGKQISYRIYLRLKTVISRCPLPPSVFEALEQLQKYQQVNPMGVEW